MGFALAGVPHRKGGVLAALDHLAESARAAPARPLELLAASADTRRVFSEETHEIRKMEQLALWALTAAPAFAWEPTKPVEIVVAAGAGGASDQMARMMQAAIQKNNLIEAADGVSLKGRRVRRGGADLHEVERR